MKHTRMTALAGALALALAGCGGDDSNGALSYSEFGTEANQVCQSTNAEVEPLAEQLTGQAQQDAPALEDVIQAQEAGVEEFRDLEPPEELQQTYDEFLAISDQQLETARAALAAAQNGDQDNYEAELAELEPLNRQSSLLASKLGAAECIGD